MRKSRWIHLAVVLTIVLSASLFPTPSQANSPMCGMFAHDFLYWDAPDANGNCPIGHYSLIGEDSLDCDGNYIHWGSTGSCEIERNWWYCGDCQIEY